MVATTKQTNANKKKEEPPIRMMQILGAVVAKKVVLRHDPKRKKLEYVSMEVGKDTLLTMVDNGVTHKFIKEEVVRNVGLKFSPTQAHLKAVKYPLDKVIGMIENVDVNIGE